MCWRDEQRLALVAVSTLPDSPRLASVNSFQTSISHTTLVCNCQFSTLIFIISDTQHPSQQTSLRGGGLVYRLFFFFFLEGEKGRIFQLPVLGFLDLNYQEGQDRAGHDMTGTRARDMDIIKIYTPFLLFGLFLSGIIFILNRGVCCLLGFFFTFSVGFSSLFLWVTPSRLLLPVFGFVLVISLSPTISHTHMMTG